MSGRLAWLSRRQIAGLGFLFFGLTGITTPLFGQAAFSPPSLPSDYTPLALPACGTAEPATLDLSTTSGPTVNTQDPHWLVSGPSLPIPGPAYYTTLSAWTALPKNWIEPVKSVSGEANAAASAGDYTYTIWFTLGCPPESYSNLQLTGYFAADNDATIYLNAFPIASCTNNVCFQGVATPFTASAPFFSPLNSLSVVVHNLELYTGVSVSAQLSGTCVDNKMCVKESGLLKVCKVAGLGVPLGTPFSFTAGGSNPFTVPAGPAPGGTCMVGPRFSIGTQVIVKEVGPTGYSVSNITVTPPGIPPAVPNLGVGGSVTVKIGAGVTETTFTDKLYAYVDKTGLLEICKSGTVTGNFTFTVSPGALAPIVVPAGGCSPAIEVPSGSVQIQEMPNSGTVMLGCATIPAANLLWCDPSSETAHVNIVPSGTASTIAFISNGPVNDPGPGPWGPANPWWWQFQQQRFAPRK